jgi:hypothetical protein
MLKLWRDAVNDFYHSIAIGNGQRSAGTEIVLYVDNYENILRGDLHSSSFDGSWA